MNESRTKWAVRGPDCCTTTTLERAAVCIRQHSALCEGLFVQPVPTPSRCGIFFCETSAFVLRGAFSFFVVGFLILPAVMKQRWSKTFCSVQFQKTELQSTRELTCSQSNVVIPKQQLWSNFKTRTQSAGDDMLMLCVNFIQYQGSCFWNRT